MIGTERLRPWEGKDDSLTVAREFLGFSSLLISLWPWFMTKSLRSTTAISRKGQVLDLGATVTNKTFK